jgi:hypothetical protein
MTPLTPSEYEQLLKKKPADRTDDCDDELSNNITGILIAFIHNYEWATTSEPL